MARYDIESFLSDLETYLKANLNSKITAINAEKADSITLSTVADGAYLFQSMNDQVANVDPFVLFGIERVQTEGEGPYTARTYSVSVIIVSSDNSTDLDLPWRMLRYGRALEDLFQDGWDKIRSSVKLKIESLAPIQFKYGSADYQAVGVSVEVNLT